MIMRVSDIAVSNVLSLWLGSFEDFGDLDEYIWASFERDFGMEFEERNAPEIDAHDQPKSVRELLDGFSFCDQWMLWPFAREQDGRKQTAQSFFSMFDIPKTLRKRASHLVPLSSLVILNGVRSSSEQSTF